MFNLLPLLESIKARVRPPVVIVLGSPAQVTDLCAGLGPMETVCYQMDVHQAGKLRIQLVEAGSAATVETHADLWDLPARFNTAIFPVAAHGERELKLDMLEQSFHVLAQRGLLISLSEYQADSLLPKWHKKVFGKCSELPTSKAGSVFWSARDGERPRRRHELTFHAKIGDGPSHNFVSRPGVFGYGALDEGARAMMETAEIRPGDRVIDLGCGPGANGVLAMDCAGAEGVATFVDSNVRATALAELNAKENGVTNFRCVTTSALEGLDPGSFDVILANPPYYANSWIAQMFIERGRALLKPGGRFYIVTKMVNHVAPAMTEVFPDSTWEERRGYHVLCGEAA
ncbi:MAG TPA: methyltransferase [Gemmataceae bacterium]|jgi:16S rRNA (guanine1207-N2)-methyltransferase|nr:methyltransferase [Gemmataceae bacterium]